VVCVVACVAVCVAIYVAVFVAVRVTDFCDSCIGLLQCVLW